MTPSKEIKGRAEKIVERFHANLMHELDTNDDVGVYWAWAQELALIAVK